MNQNDPVIAARFTSKVPTTTNMTEMNSLLKMMMLSPDINRQITYAYGTKFLMTYLTNKNIKQEKIDKEQYQWAMFGRLDKSIAISGAPNVGYGNQCGINFTDFILPLSEKWFGLGDLIKFPSNNVCRIQDEPYYDGSSWCYKFRIVTNNPNHYMMDEDLAIGNYLGCISNAFEEYSEGGHSKEVGPMWLKNHLTISRGELSVTGSAATEAIALNMVTHSGKRLPSFWIYHSEYQNMLRWEAEAEWLLWYGRSNITADGTIHLPGSNGRPVKTGAGFLEQIEGANTREYSKLTAKFLREFLMDIQLQANDSEGKHIVLTTGMGGFTEFQNAIAAEAGNLLTVDSNFISKDKKGLNFGNNFVSYTGILGTKVSLVYNAMFDNVNLNTRIDPETGLPTESFRMVAMDLGAYDGTPNLSMITKAGDGVDRSRLVWFTAGAVSPTGPFTVKDFQIRSHAKDGYSFHWLSEKGLKVMNPLACGQLIKKFNYA